MLQCQRGLGRSNGTKPMQSAGLRGGIRLLRRAAPTGPARPAVAAAATTQQQQQPPQAGAPAAPQRAQAPPPAAAGGRAAAACRRFYDAYNVRDLAAINDLIADDISYHDLVYEEPHEGRAGVMAWLEKVRQYAPDDLKFVIEDLAGDDAAAGVKWHVECGEGVFFPFSRGCSFVRLDAEGKIVSVRDVVEPAMKPGDSTLQLLGTLTPLIRSLGPAADPSNLGPALNSAALWGVYAAYLGSVMFSTLPPGPPAWATPGPVLAEAFDESVNIFWINELLSNLHLSPIPVVPHHPVSEAIFNFVIAWSVMFVPVIWTDAAAKKISNKAAWCTAIAFTTNICFLPFLALRAAPEPPPPAGGPAPRPAPGGTQAVPGWGRFTGAACLALCALSVGWAFLGRPELGGGLAERADYLTTEFGSNRVFWAFFLDCGLFSVWQALMLSGAGAGYRFVPVLGMAAWLLKGGGGGGESGSIGSKSG
ncbi:polyketide cyclase [Raphidocelis subcapitata]|uniref:Polyketide cyclase n=1 Tax=Raphidocelis subcapitata TaxID=307507 RepID=A0A2V0NK87_9CHLO|nr:polyketide cyclase [Raphidocelis subcapitata]|eukprot:GBF87696.1 polyketide cyclase [Raphidocelis subcapitata]